MAEELLNNIYMEGLDAAIMKNHRGEVCIAFQDIEFASAESIFVDRDNLAIYAILHHALHLIGHVSEHMAETFGHCKEALLTAIRPDGSLLELSAPVQVG
jgi:ssRNA-specific RNase YbeY (16S rRNA maturation enzyme)